MDNSIESENASPAASRPYLLPMDMLGMGYLGRISPEPSGNRYILESDAEVLFPGGPRSRHHPIHVSLLSACFTCFTFTPLSARCLRRTDDMMISRDV